MPTHKLAHSAAATTLISCALGSCAPTGGTAPVTAPTQARQCFSTNQVNNFRAGGPSTLYIREGRNVFELNTAGGCRELDTAVRIAIAPEGGGLVGGRPCVGETVSVAAPGATTAGPDVCRARVMRSLTAEEVAALPSAQRP